MQRHLIVAFDYQNTDYADAIGNSIKKYTVSKKKFGAIDGPGFGWKSITVYKFGIAYKATKAFTFCAGWNKGENPLTKEEVSVAFLAPAITTDHLTLGFTSKINKSSDFSMTYIKGYKNSLTGDFVSTFGGGDITVAMQQESLEFAYSKLF